MLLFKKGHSTRSRAVPCRIGTAPVSGLLLPPLQLPLQRLRLIHRLLRGRDVPEGGKKSVKIQGKAVARLWMVQEKAMSYLAFRIAMSMFGMRKDPTITSTMKYGTAMKPPTS